MLNIQSCAFYSVSPYEEHWLAWSTTTSGLTASMIHYIHFLPSSQKRTFSWNVSTNVERTSWRGRGASIIYRGSFWICNNNAYSRLAKVLHCCQCLSCTAFPPTMQKFWLQLMSLDPNWTEFFAIWGQESHMNSHFSETSKRQFIRLFELATEVLTRPC